MEADVKADATNPNVSPTVVPRENETGEDSESLVSTDTGSEPRTEQDCDEVCCDRATHHLTDLRPGSTFKS